MLTARYTHEGEEPGDVWRRVSRSWASSSEEEREFYDMMSEGRALPNTPAIANAGRDRQMGSACFVLPVEDDTEAILATLADATMIHKYGGGVGFDFTPIRGRGENVGSTGRPAPGVVEGPLKGFSEWIGRWSQAGIRNGANMGMLSIDHPDAMEFIRCKRTEGVITNFNLSVHLTDAFMESPDEELWTEIIEGAWANGEPGAFFIDTTNNTSLHPERITSTNPCGEVPLLPYEACVLGSVNLAAHVVQRNGRWVMHEPNLRRTVATLTRMLDNIVEVQDYPLPIIRETHHRYRKIGVGVMGLADALIMVGIPYDTEDALDVSEDWARIIQEESYAESERVGGTSAAVRNPHHHGRRNLCCQVIAPTGSIARIIPALHEEPVSFGIEPHFDVDPRTGKYLSFVVGSRFEHTNRFHGNKHFRTASMVRPLHHVRMQARWQKHVDQAVSKTVNLPHNATHRDVEDVYRNAWLLGCKGITVYRSHSRENVVIDCANGTCQV